MYSTPQTKLKHVNVVHINKSLQHKELTTLFQVIFLRETVYVIWDPIWQCGLLLHSDSMGVPNSFPENI